MNREDIPIELCVSKDQLLNIVSIAQERRIFAFDLEFDKNYRYYGFQLFLIQIFCDDHCFIVDPLEFTTLDTLWNIFEDEMITKVVFSGGEDIRLLHQLKCYPKNIFDCQIAAQLLDYPKTSLASILEEKLAVPVDKSQQRSDWSKRPLTPGQLAYASNDVVHLLKLRDAFLADITVSGIERFIKEENEILLEIKPVTDEIMLEESEKRDYSPFHQLILLELKKLRDQYAKKYNKPAYYIFSDTVLKSLVMENDTSIFKSKESGIYGPLSKNHVIMNELENTVIQIFHNASLLDLSKRLPDKKHFDPEVFYSNKKREKEIADRIFYPMQEYLANVYGKNAINYIFNSEVKGILTKGLKIKFLRRPYQQELILTTAPILNIDIREYL